MLARALFTLSFAAGGINAKPCRQSPSQSMASASSIPVTSSTTMETPFLYPLPTQAIGPAGEDSDAVIAASSAAAEPTYAADGSDEPVASNDPVEPTDASDSPDSSNGSDAPVASSAAIEPTYAAEPTGAPVASSPPVESSYVPVATPSDATPLPSSATAPAGATVYSGGRATWYTQDNTPGACGITHADTDDIVAISINFDANPKQHCGKRVHITSVETGKTVTATIADLCGACDVPSVDLSVGVFQNFTNTAVGHFPITWYMTGEGAYPDYNAIANSGNSGNTYTSGNTHNSGNIY